MITESTISGNQSAGGGGAVFNNASLSATNTIMAGNTGGDCGHGGSESCPTNGADGNVIGGTTAAFSPLGNYGGPTQTLIPGCRGVLPSVRDCRRIFPPA